MPLPVTEREHILPRRQPRAEPTGFTVLVADDDSMSLNVLDGILRRDGHAVLRARGGEEAYSLARANLPDLVLLDISMPPGIDGYETIRRIKSDGRLQSIPIIVISSMGDPGDKVRALTLGAVDYIAKPFRSEEVAARITTHLSLRTLQQQLSDRNAELERANRRMKHDLEAAGRVHRAMLPRSVPECAGYGIAWACRPCFEVGGDSLDVFRIDDETLGFYLLDVSGHGAAACLLAVSAGRSLVPHTGGSSIVLDGAGKIVPPGQVIHRLNALYPMEPDRNPHYITMVYCLLHQPSGRVRIATAGHPGPMVLRADGSAEILDTPGLPIGISADIEVAEMEVTLSRGDRLFLYSDGAFEQLRTDAGPFGVDRLRSALSHGPTVETSIERAIEHVLEWAQPDAITDDLSLVGLQRGTPAAKAA